MNQPLVALSRASDFASTRPTVSDQTSEILS